MDREEKQAKIKKICSALSNNGIDFDKDFPNIIKRGYGGDGCQELSDNLVEDIYGLVVQGVNDGFANEEVIKDLMDIAVELDDPKKEKKLSKYKGKREDALKDIQRTKVKEGTMDIKSEVLKYIDLAEDTAKALLEMHITEISDQKLNESLELLKELRETVSGVWDNSTRAAMKKAEEVEDCIYEWMKCGLVTTCESEHVKQLKAAVEKAREWSTLKKAAKDRSLFGFGKKAETDRVTEEEKRSIAFEESPLVDRIKKTIVGVRSLKESLAAAQALYDREKATNAAMSNTEALQAEIDENNAKVDKMMAEYRAMAIRVRNGEVKPGSTEDKRITLFAKRVKDTRDRVSLQNSQLEREIFATEQRAGIKESRLFHIGSILRELKSYADQPIVFAEAMKRLGIDKLQQFIAGGMSQKEYEEFQNGLLQLRSWAVAQANKEQEEIRRMNESKRQTDMYMEEMSQQELYGDITNEQQANDAREALDAELFGETPVEQEEETEEDKDRLRYGGSKPLSDDDM